MLPRIRKSRHAFGAFVCLAIYLVIAIASNGYQRHVKSQRLLELDLNELTTESLDIYTPELNRNAQLAYRIRHDLKALLQRPLHVWEFARVADRIALFTQLIETQFSDYGSDEGPVLSLLNSYFPWWWAPTSSHLPWHHEVGSNAHTTGIIICVRDTYVIHAIHFIRTLRNVLQSTLPIEIAFAGDNDLSPANQALIQKLSFNTETRNLLHVFDDAVTGLSNSTSTLKPFAMLASPFQKTILVDAHTIFLQTPDSLFYTEPGLIETGTLFFHDRAFVENADGRRHSWIRGLLKGRQPSEMLNQSLFWNDDVYEEMDSGVVCVDKGRPGVFVSLIFAAWMNTEHVREQITYKYVEGEKETYWLAAELIGTPYYFHLSYASAIGSPLSSKPSGICNSRSLHLDSLQRPLWIGDSAQRTQNPSSLELAKLTHWMTGASSVSDQISWKHSQHNDSTWCASGGTITPLRGSEYWEILQEIAEEARKAGLEYSAVPTGYVGGW